MSKLNDMEFRNFTDMDWMGFAGAEGPQPRILEIEGEWVMIADASGAAAVHFDEEGESTSFTCALSQEGAEAVLIGLVTLLDFTTLNLKSAGMILKSAGFKEI